MARRWMAAFERFGFDVVTICGEGVADRIVEGLGIDAVVDDPARLDADLGAALADVDLTVVENLATIPLNVPASLAVGRALAGRPAVLHHHDPPWHRERFEHVTELPLHDPAWRHVTINRITAAEMAGRGFDTTVVYNAFAPTPPGDRKRQRAHLGVAPEEVLLAHPVRAIERKNLPAAIALAEALGATYWLLGPPEEGYGATLEVLLARARCRVLHEPCAVEADLYAAADAVLFPSTWEGFGNPPLEAALHRRHCAVGHYPFAEELRSLGFRFVAPDDAETLRRLVQAPDEAVLDRNRSLVLEHFSVERMEAALRALLDEAGWLP